MRRNGHQHFLGGLLLHDVAVGTGTKRAFRVDGLVVHGENQHRQVGVRGANALEQFEAVRTVERDVEDHDVRSSLGDGLHGGLRLFGLAADLHILLLVDQQRESLAHEWMIVDDKNRLLGSLCWSLQNGIRRHSLIPSLSRGHGKDASDTVPCSGFGLISNLPPIMPAR